MKLSSILFVIKNLTKNRAMSEEKNLETLLWITPRFSDNWRSRILARASLEKVISSKTIFFVRIVRLTR